MAFEPLYERILIKGKKEETMAVGKTLDNEEALIAQD